MTSHADTLNQLLGSPRSAALKRLLAGTSNETLREDTAELEAFILKNAPAGARLDRLVDLAHARILALYPGKASFLRQKATYEYPTYRTVLTERIAEARKIFTCAENWLEERQRSRKPPAPAARIAGLIVAMILDFQLLDQKMILPLLESLRDLRLVPLDDGLIGIAAVMRHSNTNQERFLSVGGAQARKLKKRLNRPNVQAWLATVIASCGKDPGRVLDLIDADIQSSTGANFFTVAGLIEAAGQVAIKNVPTSVLAVRTGLTTSHALKPSALERMTGCREGSPATNDDNDGDEEEDDQENSANQNEDLDTTLASEPGWRADLRVAVRKTAVDQVQLQTMANSSHPATKWIGLYALDLIRKNRGLSTIYKYVLLVADRLLVRLADRDPAEFEIDEWEELVERILDEDAYYHRQVYSGRGDRDSAGYSQSLIKALRGFATLVHAGKKGTHPLASLLPKGGLVHVNANFVTVDEYREALDWFGSYEVDPLKLYFNAACRAALILGFRLGLRRSEVAYLRACDFDLPLEGEDLTKANLHVHIRAWFLHKLKTSHAERDLPLAPLVPPDELEELLRFVNDARKAAGTETRLFRNRLKPQQGMKFDRVADALDDAFLGSQESKRPVADFNFHLLRHSAANFWLLKLQGHLLPVARCVLEGHPLTLEWIGEKDFRDRLLQSNIHGSDLQAIALLLGHGSGAVSVEHYLHVLEWHRKKQRKILRPDMVKISSLRVIQITQPGYRPRCAAEFTTNRS